MSASLVIRGLRKEYRPGVPVLRDVSLEVGGTGMTAIIGPSGTGKSTLIRCINRLVDPTAGEILFGGQDLARLKGRALREARRRIGMVFQEYNLVERLSVIENLVMAARPGVDGRRDWTLERVLETFPRLAERRNHGGTQLSGGEQQMLSIGRALMTHPDVLFLDEATEGLAPLIVAEIWQIIGRIRASGIATVVVDKNFRSVLQSTDRAVVMVKGEVALESPSAQLLANPQALQQLLGV